jgi:hypothetical protein
VAKRLQYFVWTMTSKPIKRGLPAAVMASEHSQSRREPRFPLKFEIEVCGIGNDLQPFRVRTATMDVSEWGCRFGMPIHLEADSIVTLRTLTNEEEQQSSRPPVMFQIVRVWESKDGWEIAAWKMGPEKVWPVDLPETPADDHEEETARTRRDGTEQ